MTSRNALSTCFASGRAPRYRTRPMWTRNCHRRSYYLRDIERQTVPHVAKVFASPDTVKQMAEEFERWAGANQRAANNELPKIVKRLEEIEAGTLQLVTGLERGSLPEGIIAERLQALEAERVALAEKRRIAESKVVKLAILPSALRKWHADLQFLAAKLHDGAGRGSARRCGTCWIASSFIGAQAQAAKDRTARASGGSGWRAPVSAATLARGDRRTVWSGVPAKWRSAEIQPFFGVELGFVQLRYPRNIARITVVFERQKLARHRDLDAITLG